MSHVTQISPQVDVANATLQGLAAFTPLLAALSADNVAPMAMIQAEALGALFHTNGKYAKQVPDLLQRVASVRLHRVGMTFGWRKGDAASTLAASAGGQAFALMSMVIVNLWPPGDCGNILQGLSTKLLTRNLAIASTSQLADVAKVASFKLEQMGFGNEMAHWTSLVFDCYDKIKVSFPEHFFERLSINSAVDLFQALSRLREDGLIVRIEGTRAMANILGIVNFMFPEQTVVVVKGVIIKDSHSPRIWVQLGDGNLENADIAVETQLSDKTHRKSLKSGFITRCIVNEPYSNLRYCWEGCLADHLCIAFLDNGKQCSQELLTACCDFICQTVHMMRLGDTRAQCDEWARICNISCFLGPYPIYRVTEICDQVWRTRPRFSDPEYGLREAYCNLQTILERDLGSLACVCHRSEGRKNAVMEVWLNLASARRNDCRRCHITANLGLAVSNGFSCLLVNAQKGATVRFPAMKWEDNQDGPIVMHVARWLSNMKVRLENAGIPRNVARTFFGVPRTTGIAETIGSSTLYLAALEELMLPSQLAAQFILVEGQIMYERRYYSKLACVTTSMDIAQYSKGLQAREDSIAPSADGVAEQVDFTIRERIDCLELRTTVRYKQQSAFRMLTYIITHSWGVHQPSPCIHSMATPLLPVYKNKVITTSVAAPHAADKDKIAIVQTHGDRASQLLCCMVPEPRAGPDEHRSIVHQIDCCLNCIMHQIINEGQPWRTIIVA